MVVPPLLLLLLLFYVELQPAIKRIVQIQQKERNELGFFMHAPF